MHSGCFAICAIVVVMSSSSAEIEARLTAGWPDSRVVDLLLWRRPLASLVVVLLGATGLAAGEFALRGGHSLTLLSGAALSSRQSSGGNAVGAACMFHRCDVIVCAPSGTGDTVGHRSAAAAALDDAEHLLQGWRMCCWLTWRPTSCGPWCPPGGGTAQPGAAPRWETCR